MQYLTRLIWFLYKRFNLNNPELSFQIDIKERKWVTSLANGPLFFNIFINDLFLFIEITTFFNYAFDNTIYFPDKNAKIVVSTDLEMILR